MTKKTSIKRTFILIGALASALAVNIVVFRTDGYLLAGFCAALAAGSFLLSKHAPE